ncbi:hypothetical protein GXP70_23775 [Paenibacillus lycopersici]|uniref:Transposase DDE domain-containing protein n=1 Tax=Paenibacillus lycopersici TaxID=2704462 RepID=A0A6C0G571_9BACL|nr:hypothetical protein GXP70_23775 [Paenibacillus lycopersici]
MLSGGNNESCVRSPAQTCRFQPNNGFCARSVAHEDDLAATGNVEEPIRPQQQELPYRTTAREGYRHYASDLQQCASCPMLDKCKRSRNKRKIVTRHIWEDSKEQVRLNRLSKSGKRLYRKR